MDNIFLILKRNFFMLNKYHTVMKKLLYEGINDEIKKQFGYIKKMILKLKNLIIIIIILMLQVM